MKNVMRYLKIVFRILVLAVYCVAVDYNLPSVDIVRVVGTEVVRTDLGSNAFFWGSSDTGSETGNSRDIRFINTVFPDEKPRVYRNEDTSFGWPPYFKFDSGNLQARAQNMAGEWAAVRHYGWRFTALSIYPNAVSIRSVSSPNVSSTNWIRIIGIIFFGLLALAVWRLWYLFRLWIREKIHLIRHRIG